MTIATVDRDRPGVDRLMAFAGLGDLAGAVDEMTRRGFAEDFRVVDGRLQVMGTGERVRPEQCVIVEYHRFEGPERGAAGRADPGSGLSGVSGSLAQAQAARLF
jgi:hypothetical protein